jgi:hypothetical protein
MAIIALFLKVSSVPTFLLNIFSLLRSVKKDLWNLLLDVQALQLLCSAVMLIWSFLLSFHLQSHNLSV